VTVAALFGFALALVLAAFFALAAGLLAVLALGCLAFVCPIASVFGLAAGLLRRSIRSGVSAFR
jgi:hypothetical protein